MFNPPFSFMRDGQHLSGPPPRKQSPFAEIISVTFFLHRPQRMSCLARISSPPVACLIFPSPFHRRCKADPTLSFLRSPTFSTVRRVFCSTRQPFFFPLASLNVPLSSAFPFFPGTSQRFTEIAFRVPPSRDQYLFFSLRNGSPKPTSFPVKLTLFVFHPRVFSFKIFFPFPQAINFPIPIWGTTFFSSADMVCSLSIALTPLRGLFFLFSSSRCCVSLFWSFRAGPLQLLERFPPPWMHTYCFPLGSTPPPAWARTPLSFP